MRKVDNDFQLQLEDISDDEFPLETSVEIELEDIRLAMHLLSSRISVKMTWRTMILRFNLSISFISNQLYYH